MTSPIVRASGGVVLHEGAVVLVHRPRYDDWTLPKGKRDPGETDEQCAVREVEEETGLRCALGRELLPTRYVDRRRRPKVVRYWEMRVLADRGFEANDEIDDVVWVPIEAAAARLTYPHDAELISNVRLSFISRSLHSG